MVEDMQGEKEISVLSEYIKYLRPVAAMLLVGIMTTAGMFVFQEIKHQIIPEINIWQSHLFTNLFTGVVASFVSLLVFIGFESLYQKNKRERENLRRAQNSNLFLASIVESSDDAIIGRTTDGKITSWNSGAERLYGYTAKEALGKPIDIIIPDECREEYFESIEYIRNNRRVRHYETKRMDRNGRRIDISTTVSPIFDMAGNIIGISSITRDITEKKKSEQALKKNKAILDRAQRVARVGHWAWNLETNAFNCSSEMFRIFGYDPGAIRPTYDWVISCIYAEDRHLIQEAVRQALSENRQVSVDYRIRLPDISTRYINTVFDKVKRDPQGNPLWIYGISQDITRRKMIENELVDAKSQAELYVDLMGHDINNMNQVALGYLELALDAIAKSGKIETASKDLLLKPMEYLKNSSMLIENVRKLQREKMGGYREKVIDINQAIADVQAQCSSAPDRDVKILFKPEAHCLVMANELFRDVVLNLVGNSIKHSTGPLTINITSDRTFECGESYCRISIEDDGPGIPDVQKKHLLEGSTLTRTRARGKGLGLCLVRTLIDDFRGHISIEDRVPGDHTRGCKFVITIPAL
jgi:PAS domain S-box-containing protein